MNVARSLENSAYFFPDRIAVSEGDTKTTYAQLNERANRIATSLVGLGIKPGDHIALAYPNSMDWIAFYFGTLKAGAVAVTLSTALFGEELKTLINHAKPRVVLIDEPKLAIMKELKGAGAVEKIVCPGGDVTVQDLVDKGSPSFRAVYRDRLDTAVIPYTGGTTGMPKGVMITQEHILFSYQAIAVSERTTQYDIALCFLPFNHVFGQIHIMGSTIFSGGCVELLPMPDPEQILALMESGRATKFFAVPTIYVRLLTYPDLGKKVGNLRYCFSAGASIAMEIVRRWKEVTGINISESYGMTEGIPFTFNHYYPEKHVVGSVGQPVHLVEIQIRDTSGNEVEQGKEGEICMRAPNVMKGYLNNPEATEATFWPGRWLRSGDLGYMDPQGYVYIVDRLKDLIITGGENVYPREVEELLYTRPEVQECSVVGLPDKEWGERVAAFIIPKPGQTVVANEIKSFLKTKLAPYKVPKEYVTVEELPKSAAGKILKRQIKQEYVEAGGKQQK